MEYVYGMLLNGADPDALQSGSSIAYHSHCQQRTLGLDEYTEAVFENLGFDVITSDVECCGMAGSFGYKSEYYDLSMDVGSDLREQFTDEGGRTFVASGASCIEQIDDLFREPTRHPIEIISPKRD